MTQPVPPYWFRLRQGKMEPAGENTYRLTAPNLREAFIAVRPDGSGYWLAAFKEAADGPDVATHGTHFDDAGDAWNAAFELYRTALVI